MRKTKVVLISISFALGSLYLASTVAAKPNAPGLRIGILTADSGELYFAGTIQRAATKLAVKDLEDAVRISLSFEDPGDTDAEARSAINRLKEFEPQVLLAPIESNSARQVIRALDKTMLPMIATTPLEENLGLNSKEKTWLFRLSSTQSQDSFALASCIAKTKPSSVLVVYAETSYGKAIRRSVSFALTMHGTPKVQSLAITDLKGIRKAQPEVLVLASMEESLVFLDQAKDWLERIPQVYFVPGNLANYSGEPFASELTGVEALVPKEVISASFRARLATALNNPALNTARASFLALGQRTYDSIVLAAESAVGLKKNESLRSALATSELGGSKRFSAQGYLEQPEYTVFRYLKSGDLASVGSFSPN